MDHSRTLGFSPRLRVSVYGTVSLGTSLRGFSRRHDYGLFAGPEGPFGIGARLSRSFIPRKHLPPYIGIHHPTVLSLPRPPSGSNAPTLVQEC